MGEPESKTESTIEIRIDRQVCMGSGNCQFWAPNVFDLGDDGVAVVVDPEGDPEEKVVLAARGCPTGAITVFRDGEQVAGPSGQSPGAPTGTSGSGGVRSGE